MSQFTLAVAQYDISFFTCWQDFATKLETWISRAAAKGARLLVFPEYGSMELTSLFDEEVYSDLTKQLDAMQTLSEQWHKLHSELAAKYNVHLLASSFPTRTASGDFVNRANFFSPEGLLGFQDKMIMTRFENEKWHISAGQELKVFDTPLGKIGIHICYDSEFPMIASEQVRAGADLLLVPSCTDTEAGFHRVRIGCQARALENQCYVVQSPTLGDAPWSPAVDANTGRASVYTPVDYGFPDNGILAEGSPGIAEWVYADVDLNEIARVRQQGQVFNYRDWPKQFSCKLSKATDL